MTAEWVAEKRAAWGNTHVTDMLKKAMAGQRNCCYAVEQVKPDVYRTFGQPFDWNASDSELLGKCMVFGLKFAGIMQPPKGVQHGTS
jgi:hypothetical protein